MEDCVDRCINVPSWSLPISVIVSVSELADELGVSQSSIVREALEEKLRAMKQDVDLIQCENKSKG